MWTNERVQAKFTEAIDYLKPRVHSIEDEIVLNALTYFKMYSASGKWQRYPRLGGSWTPRDVRLGIQGIRGLSSSSESSLSKQGFPDQLLSQFFERIDHDERGMPYSR